MVQGDGDIFKAWTADRDAGQGGRGGAGGGGRGRGGGGLGLGFRRSREYGHHVYCEDVQRTG